MTLRDALSACTYWLTVVALLALFAGAVGVLSYAVYRGWHRLLP